MNFFDRMSTVIIDNINDFRKARAYLELLLFVYSILMIMKTGFFVPISMFMFLRVKFSVD